MAQGSGVCSLPTATPTYGAIGLAYTGVASLILSSPLVGAGVHQLPSQAGPTRYEGLTVRAVPYHQ
jgi:hypothetical protein